MNVAEKRPARPLQAGSLPHLLDRQQGGTPDVRSDDGFTRSIENALAERTDRKEAQENQLLVSGRSASGHLEVDLVDAGNAGRKPHIGRRCGDSPDFHTVGHPAGAAWNLITGERVEGRGVSAGRRVADRPQTDSVGDQELSDMGRILLRDRRIIRCVLNEGVTPGG